MDRKVKTKEIRRERTAEERQEAIRKVREMRERVMPYAATAGYLTDEDVFRDVP